MRCCKICNNCRGQEMERKIKIEFTEMELNLLLGMMSNTLDVVAEDLNNPDRMDSAALVLKLIKRMNEEIGNKIDEKEDSMESHS